jgi:hypothetical protein
MSQRLSRTSRKFIVDFFPLYPEKWQYLSFLGVIVDESYVCASCYLSENKAKIRKEKKSNNHRFIVFTLKPAVLRISIYMSQ